MMARKVYPSLREVVAAFHSGELNRATHYLVIDKGGSELYLRRRYDESLSEDENDELDLNSPRMSLEASPLSTALELLGIPAEWA
jgi:hypothetical protein